MNRLACAVAIVPVFVFTAASLGAQPSSNSLDTYPSLWVAHAAFQTMSIRDYVTPIIVKTLLACLRTNPLYSKTADVLADGAIDLTSIASDHVTGLDAAEQQELEDVLYRRAAGEIPEAYAAAQKLANRNPAFRAALNTIPGPALNVQVGETAESIKTKSPALVAALTEDQMLAARGRAMWSFPAAHIAESPSSRPVITRIRLFAAGRRASASDGQRIRASPAGIAEFIENSPQKDPFADQDRAALSPS